MKLSWLDRDDLVGSHTNFTYEKRRGRESNPRIAVLQTATLPLGYPADSEKRQTISACGVSVNAVGSVGFHQQYRQDADATLTI
jgi:hypothetical protein